MTLNISLMDLLSSSVCRVLSALCFMSTCVYGVCQNLEVSGSYFSTLDGIYTKTTASCGSRPSYQRNMDQSFLSYDSFGYWVIHSALCASESYEVAFARVRDDVSYPEYIIDAWEERDVTSGENVWKKRYELNLSCIDDDNTRNRTTTGISMAQIVMIIFIVPGVITFGCVSVVMKRRQRRMQGLPNPPVCDPIVTLVRPQCTCSKVTWPWQRRPETDSGETRVRDEPSSHVSQETIATAVEGEPGTQINNDESVRFASNGDISTIQLPIRVDAEAPPPTYTEATSEEGISKYPKRQTDEPPAYSEV